MKWNIKLYEKENGKIPVEEFMSELPAKHKEKIDRTIKLLKQFGTELPQPHAEPIDGKLWELRTKLSSNISRVFYFLTVGNTFILLHGFTKKTQKTPPNEIEKAKEYMRDYLRRC
jgi:phage-related protein